MFERWTFSIENESNDRSWRFLKGITCIDQNMRNEILLLDKYFFNRKYRIYSINNLLAAAISVSFSLAKQNLINLNLPGFS